MDDITRIVIDAMGGDNAPTCNIQGAVDSVNIHKDVHIILVGKEDGIAPDSKLVYFSSSGSTADRLQALRRIVEINKNSSPDDKIKVLSIRFMIEFQINR